MEQMYAILCVCICVHARDIWTLYCLSNCTFNAKFLHSNLRAHHFVDSGDTATRYRLFESRKVVWCCCRWLWKKPKWRLQTAPAPAWSRRCLRCDSASRNSVHMMVEVSLHRPHTRDYNDANALGQELTQQRGWKNSSHSHSRHHTQRQCKIKSETTLS